MKVTHDKKTDSAYIYLCDIKPGEAARQVAIENCTIILDFDKEGKALGIEFLNATARLPKEVLDLAELKLFSYCCTKCGTEWVGPTENGPGHCYGDCGGTEFKVTEITARITIS